MAMFNSATFSQTIKKPSETIIQLMIFLSGILLFCIGTNQFDFGNEESRFIAFAQEMLRHGITPFPLLQGKFYPDYPATTTIFIYGFSLLFNKVTPFTSVLPGAIASALTLVFTYKIAALHNSRWGIVAVLLSLMTYVFLLLARLPSPDPFLAAITIMAFYDVYQRKCLKNQFAIGWSPILLIAGFCLRGPMGLVVPALVTGFFYLVEKNWRWFFLTGIYSVTLLLIFTGAELYVAQIVDGKTFAEEVFRMQVGGRLEHLGQRPFYYYFTSGVLSYALAFPLAIATVITHWKEIFLKVSELHIHLLKQLMTWALVILILFSFPHEKHFRYVLAITPALALLAAYLWITPKTSQWINRAKKLIKIICWTLPILGLMIVIACLFLTALQAWQFNFYVAPAILFFILSLLLLILAQRKFSADAEWLTLAAGALAYLTLFIAIAQPIANQYLTSVRPLFNQIEKLRGKNLPLIFYTDDQDRDNLKFLVLLNPESPPVYIANPEQLIAHKEKAIFLANERFFLTVPQTVRNQFEILIKQEQARRSWIVFTQKD